MAIDVTQLVDYAWSDIAKAAKTSMITAALGGGELIVNGRTIVRLKQQEAEDLYNLAVRMMNIESDSGSGGDTALVQFGES